MPDKRYIGRLVRDIRSLSLPHDQASEWLSILWYPSRAAARFASVDVDHQPDCPGVRPEYRYVGVRVNGVVEVLECPVCHAFRWFINGQPKVTGPTLSALERRLAPIVRDLWGADPDDPNRAPTQAAVANVAGYTAPRGLEKALAKEPGLWARLTARRPEGR
jgi:hypothetical protein